MNHENLYVLVNNVPEVLRYLDDIDNSESSVPKCKARIRSQNTYTKLGHLQVI